MFKSETRSRLATIEHVLRRHEQGLVDLRGERVLGRLVSLEESVDRLQRQSPTHFDLGRLKGDLAEHREDSRALFLKIADLFGTVDETIRLQDEKLDALAAFVGGRFVNQPAQPERVVVEPVEPLEDEAEEVEFEIVWEEDDDDGEVESPD